MARHRIEADRVQTQLENKRRFEDKACSIDDALDEAIERIDWQRREKAHASLLDFIKTYCVGLMIDEAPSPRYEQAIAECEYALGQSRPYNIELGRGSGKTSLVEMAVLYMLTTARCNRKYCVIVSQSYSSAQNILKDCWQPIIEPDTAFAIDHPEICLPYQICTGSYRRRQLYKGETTDLQKTASTFVFPRLRQADGKPYPTSGSILTCKGISSGVRGLKSGTLRPDVVILDDLQTAETAANPEQVQKILGIIKKDILNLSARGKLAVLNTCTPIAPDDLAQKLEEETAWKTTKYPTVISWPVDIRRNPETGLWAEYFRLYDSENAQEKPHKDSLRFYVQHRAEMDEGAEVFQPDRFNPRDGHISGLQAILEKRHLIGDAPFASEYQMEPRKQTFCLDISVKQILAKAVDVPMYKLPEGGYSFVVASSDLNVSRCITTVIVGFQRDMTAHVLAHMITPCKIPTTLPAAEYNTRVHAALYNLGVQLHALGVVQYWGIDGNGVPFEAVCDFCKTVRKSCGLQAVAMIGRANHVFYQFPKSRLRQPINDTVLCGDSEERVRTGAGRKWIAWNADKHKTASHKALIAPPMSRGGCTLYAGDAEKHLEFSQQICNERLVAIQNRQDGKEVYQYQTREPHDFGDALGQAYALAASQGLGTGAVQSAAIATPRKRKYRFV